LTNIRDGKIAPLRRKLAWTVFFLACFLAGRFLPIPFVQTIPAGSGDYGAQSSPDLLNAANIATGGNFFNPSLFSLGLGPWMGAAILWRFLFIGRFARQRNIPESTVSRARNGVMVALAVFQAISMMSQFRIQLPTWAPFIREIAAQVVVVLYLTCGAVLVAWLAQRNENRGLGGMTMFILYQIVITGVQNRAVFSVVVANPAYSHIAWLVFVACACVVVAGVLVGNREVRLHVNKVSIDSGYIGMSYLPIKFNPAGASPIMYALTLLVLPQYVARAVGVVFPSTGAGVERFVSIWGLTSPLGLSVYLVLLLVLSVFFGLFTVNPKDIAERMHKAGEYLDSIPPGSTTRQYLHKRVAMLSAISGIFLIVFTGIPMLFIGSYPELQYLLTTPGILVMLVALLWLLQEEIADTIIGTKYVFTLNTAAKTTAAKATAGRAAV
jgi:preprotein translocase subunit SecY